MKILSPFVIAALVLGACATGPLIIPDTLTPSELIQRAQEASDNNRYNHAEQYYQALLERNPDNIDLVCTAEYEIAFIHYKQKNYSLSKKEFNALLERYEGEGGRYLPPQFRLLSIKVLERIEEKEQSRTLFTGWI